MAYRFYCDPLQPNYNITFTIFFFRNFLAYKWGMEVFRIAHDRVVKGRRDLLIVIRKDKIKAEKLPPDLRPYISKYKLPPDLRLYTVFVFQKNNL